ncbi:hypothetical protein PanWU01x14_301300, partial [Parasponia andersonii]
MGKWIVEEDDSGFENENDEKAKEAHKKKKNKVNKNQKAVADEEDEESTDFENGNEEKASDKAIIIEHLKILNCVSRNEASFNAIWCAIIACFNGALKEHSTVARGLTYK